MKNILDKFILENLKNYGLTTEEIVILITGAEYYSKTGGIGIESFCKNEKLDNRDEYLIVCALYFYLFAKKLKYEAKNEWKGIFDIGYLEIGALNFPTCKSIDGLTSLNCYSDTFALLRVLHSRVNLITLFSLNPSLIKLWEKDESKELFLDGKIRQELENNGLNTMPFMYKYYSEILHNRPKSIEEIGVFSGKPFSKIKPIWNTIYISAKYFIGYLIHISIETLKLDTSNFLKDDFDIIASIISKFKKSIFLNARIDHLNTFISEERFWVKQRKNEFQIGGAFNFDEYSLEVQKYHKKSGQKKRLSKKYNL